MKWQPIESAPDTDEIDVLIFVDGDMDIGYRFFRGNDEYICRQDEWHNGHDCAPKTRRPTHWMPLPEPPNDTTYP